MCEQVPRYLLAWCDTMQECPYCGSNLNGPVGMNTKRNSPATGGKSTNSELVSCPDCDEVIDGFAAH
jgi:hypothetical protein